MKITCPHCGLTGKIPEGDAGDGTSLVCPRCERSFDPRKKPVRTEQPQLFGVDEPPLSAEAPPEETVLTQETELEEEPPPADAPLAAVPVPPIPEVPKPYREVSFDDTPSPAESGATTLRQRSGNFAPAAHPSAVAEIRRGVPAFAVFWLGLLLLVAAGSWYLALNLHLGRAARGIAANPALFPLALAGFGVVAIMLTTFREKSPRRRRG
jgi:hypothetical protein